MSLDFARVKEISIADVVCRYGVNLRFKGVWGAAVCPLPTHKQGDKDKSFSVNTQGNYWKCFSASCNENNGGKKGGDCINFVALMENISQAEAAKKLAGWFNVQEKAAPHIEKRQAESTSAKTHSDHTAPTDKVKVGHMQAVGLWFDTFIVRRPDEADDAYYKRVKKGVLGQVYESFKNGQRKAQGLPAV
jgi:hypothetical protein